MIPKFRTERFGMWLYIPDSKPTSRSTPVAADSISDSDSRIQKLSASYTWNESYRQPRSWLTILKRDSWMQHLFGLIPEPSTADRLLTKWIGSLGAFPASRSVSPETEKEPMTSDGSGSISGDWLLRYDPDFSGWRTPQVSLFEMELEPFSENFPKSGTMRNGCVYERVMSAHRIAESASSSWPTARANDPEKRGNISNDPRHGLPAIAQHWPTPAARDYKGDYSDEALTRKDGQSRMDALPQVTSRWATPEARDGKGHTTTEKHPTGFNKNLPNDVQNWLAPSANEDAAGTLAGNMQNMLSHQVQAQAQSGEMSSAEDQTSHRQWRTPVKSEAEGGTMKMGGIAHYKLGDQVGSRKRLNPRFVEWLMGWPEGWLDLHSFVSSATE